MLSAAARQTQKVSLVIGLGQTGLSCARFLAGRGERVLVTDSRRHPPGLDSLQRELPVVEWLGAFPDRLPEGLDRVVVSPGVPVTVPLLQAARERGIEIVGDIELFAREAAAPIIAVTGSNGKSTVISLLVALGEAAGLRVLPGGNLGRPALDLLSEPVPDAYLLELSSFQLESTHGLNAAVGAVLNVSEDHMDRYAGVQDYAAAKQRLAAQCRIAVLNRDDTRVAAMPVAGERVTFGLDAPEVGHFGLLGDEQAQFFARGREPVCPVSALPLTGRHNQANALAALAIADAAGWSLTRAAQGLAAFKGLPHRMERVATIDGIDWFNDSKATNVGATVAALQGMDRPVVLIAGGDGKGQDFSPLTGPLRGHVRALITIGRDGRRIAAVAPAGLPVQAADSLQAAVRIARSFAGPGDAVLLSPACASFDMFEGFEHRGREFANLVRRMA
jgi:UDP-N-acetylmuramoylalanine--D-glutamate ligase